MVSEFAPSKINLSLHITGRDCNGYHLLDSLVVFADIGDHISARLAPEFSLTIGGAQAEGLSSGPDNLVWRTANLMLKNDDTTRLAPRHMALHLEKTLPVASGIGGGSADAAATLRLLAHVWSSPLPAWADIAELGADVPVCMSSVPQRMQGIGARTSVLRTLLPKLGVLLINPKQALSTAAVFRALARRENNPMPQNLPHHESAGALCAFLRHMRNDLQPAATLILPDITQVLQALLGEKYCLFARMSGSGATCFGLFADVIQAHAAADRLARRAPDWWVRAGRILT